MGARAEAASAFDSLLTNNTTGVAGGRMLKRRERRAPVAGRGLQPASIQKPRLTHDTSGRGWWPDVEAA